MASAARARAGEVKRVVAAASTNATVVLAAPGRVTGIYAFSVSASIRYLKLYDKATAPTVGTDVPVLVMQLSNIGANGNPREVRLPGDGLWFENGIGLALTGAADDADTTALTAGDIQAYVFYERGAKQ